MNPSLREKTTLDVFALSCFYFDYTGLRIGDAVSCSAERFSAGRLLSYTQKTGTHVHCPLPDFVIKELEALAKKSDRHWFWTANCKLKTAVTGIRRTWTKDPVVLLETKGTPEVHPDSARPN